MNSELGERLRQRMEYATAEIRVPRGLAHRAARHRRRRIMFRAGAAAVTATAVTAAVLVSAATGATRDTGPTATARLARDVESALDTAASGDDIVYVQIPELGIRSWDYRRPDELLMRQESLSPSGRPLNDRVSVVTSTSDASTFVDYAAKTWYFSAHPGQPLPPVAAPRTSCSTDINALRSLDPADIRESLTCGELTDEGTQYVNGVHAIKLVAVRTGGAPVYAVLTVTLWVDPATYLPTRYQWTLSGRRTQGHGARMVENITWLPPTVANLTRLRVPIPAGFTQVTPPKS